MRLRPALTLGLLLVSTTALAQDSGESGAASGPITSPGTQTLRMPSLGGADRFTRDFNPAISLVADGLFDYTEFDGARSETDGGRLELRSAELLTSAWVDDSAWIQATVSASEDEFLLEEASLRYHGLGEGVAVRAGRFYIDFGKQMQSYEHELRTVDRPLPLREYLGREVRGDGLQIDHLFSRSDTTAMRYSIGVFQDLVTERDEDDVYGAPPTTVPVQDDRRQLGDFNFTGRITAVREMGGNAQAQLGASTRLIPDLRYADSAQTTESERGSNTTIGLDLTYGWTDPEKGSSWTVGGEWLRSKGALSAVDNAGTIEVHDGSASGYYAFLDRGFDEKTSVGGQFAHAQLVDAGAGDASVYDVYYTRRLSPFLRLRVALTYTDFDNLDDSTRVAIQLTGFIGTQDHGVNW